MNLVRTQKEEDYTVVQHTYDQQNVVTQISDYTPYASVTEGGRDRVRIHSHVEIAVNKEEELQTTFLDTLRSYPNQEMCKTSM